MKSMKACVILCLRVTLLLRNYLKSIFDIFVFVFFILLFPSINNSGLSYCKTFLKLKASQLDFKFGSIQEVFVKSFYDQVNPQWFITSNFSEFHLDVGCFIRFFELLSYQKQESALRLFSFSHIRQYTPRQHF